MLGELQSVLGESPVANAVRVDAFDQFVLFARTALRNRADEGTDLPLVREKKGIGG